MSEPREVSRGERRPTDDLSQSYVLVGIPAYNEVVTVAEVVNAAQTVADDVLVVDDGSDDRTAERARNQGANVISHETNRGYGSTLETIFQYAEKQGPDHLVILDADGQHDVGDVPHLVKTQQTTGAQLVTGSRFTGNPSPELPLYRRFGLAVINLLTNLSLRVGYSYPSVSDSQCGFRAYNREAIEAVANMDEIDSGMGASLDILFETARRGYDIVEVPTKIDYNVEDANTKNPVVHGLQLLQSLFFSVTSDRPVRIVSAGCVSLLVAIGFILTIVQIDLGTAHIVVIVLLIIGTLLSFTLSRTTPKRSDRTDQ